VHRGAVEQPAAEGFGPFSPEAGERRGGDLNQTALVRPLQDALRRLLQDRVPFWMSDDRYQSAISQAKEAVLEPSGDTEVAEFNQQIVGFAYGVGMWLFEDALQILKRKMKIAAQT